MQLTVARPNALAFKLKRARLFKSGTSITNAAFRIHLFTAAPVAANGDNGVFSVSQAAAYLGFLDVTTMLAFTDGAAGQGLPSLGTDVPLILPSGQIIYALLECRGAYTPVSAETFTVTLEIEQACFP
jgi:hypothetical protein